MKKISFLFLIAIVATTVKAQDLVSYRGAFAPAPTRQWTDGWTNWDPQITVYNPFNLTISGTITTNTTWTANNVYLLDGLVYVDSLVTLTIEPGTVIKGLQKPINQLGSTLIVERGGKLLAEGTECNPIVFTSNFSPNNRNKGDWGGVILLGSARHNLGTNIAIEGLPVNDPENYHGGVNDNDNSGVLKYVRIEFGGYVFSDNNEINGLTMGSVGRGTVIDYVQTSFSNDDAFEWFGGSVNCKHLVAYRCLDDDFDTDNGFSGTVQYGLGVKDPAISDNPAVSTSEGFESDGNLNSTGQLPKTTAKFYNITCIGAWRCGAGAPSATGFRRSVRLRRNTDLKIYNSIFMNTQFGIGMTDAITQNNANEDSVIFRNNIIAANYSANPTHVAWENAATRTAFSLASKPAFLNDSINSCTVLVNAYNFLAPDYRPNIGGAGAAAITNVATTPDLTPTIDIDNTVFTPNQASDFVVNIFEDGAGTTSGLMVFTLTKAPGWDFTVPGIALTGTNQSGNSGNSNVFGGTPNGNSNWFFRENATTITVTSKPGVIIAQSASAIIGFTATRKTSTTTGTSQSISVNINNGSGGDNTPVNNLAVLTFGTSN